MQANTSFGPVDFTCYPNLELDCMNYQSIHKALNLNVQTQNYDMDPRSRNILIESILCDPNSRGLLLYFFIFFNNAHEQCLEIVQEHCSSNNFTAQCSVPQDGTALSCVQVHTLCPQVMHVIAHAEHNTAQPAQPCRDTKRLCRDRENSVTTDFSFTPKRRCRDIKKHVATQDQPTLQHHCLCHDTKALAAKKNLSRHKERLLGHKVGQLCRDK